MTWTPPSDGAWAPPGPRSSDPKPEPKSEATGPLPGKVWTPGKQPPPVEPTPVTPKEIDPQGGPVKAWSASLLDKFEECPYRVFLNKVKKHKEPGSEAGDRGSRIHDLAEHYIDGTIGDIPDELTKFDRSFDQLRELYADGKVICEEDWGFNINWEPVEWMAPDIWGRMKLDVAVFEDETSVKIIDHKTGKKFGNEIKHNKQAMVYAVGVFQRFPEVEFVTTDFWYLDKGETMPNNYSRRHLNVILKRINDRATRMTSCLDFKPKPGRSACRFCPFAKDGTCEWAYNEV